MKKISDACSSNEYKVLLKNLLKKYPILEEEDYPIDYWNDFNVSFDTIVNQR